MFKISIVVVFLLIVVSGTAIAQNQCPAVVQNAITVIGANCANTGRNQACYGNPQIRLTAQPGMIASIFASPGDLVAVEAVQSITLSAMNQTMNEWGLALLSVQANLPDTIPGQNVTMLLFGETTITNGGTSMEAVYFKSGVGSSDCAEAPNGMLIQSPQGGGTIQVSINGVGVTLGSTAYVVAEPEGLMNFALLEGNSTLSVGDDTVTLEAGQFSTVELDADLEAISPPSEPLPIVELPDLPLSVLPLEVILEPVDTGGAIIPRNGNWTYTTGEVSAAGCPAQMVSILTGSMSITETSFVDFGGVPFDLQSFLTTNSTEPLPGFGAFTQPDPNTHQWSFSEDGASFTYQMRILSETAGDGFFLFELTDQGLNCTITVPFEIVLNE